MQLKEAIEQIIEKVNSTEEVKQKYVERLTEGALVRDENPISHFCSYFLPYRLKDKKVFLQAHIKSGLWLAPGGHIDLGETPVEAAEREMVEELGIQMKIEQAKFLTITNIKRDVRSCTVHYDIWHFVRMDDQKLPTSKEGEFNDARWFTLEEARRVVTDESNLEAFDFVEKELFT